MKPVPLVNADHMQLLTSENWLALGTRALAFDLEALLIKPGFDVLIQQRSLAAFLGWPHEIWLVVPTLTGVSLKLRSPFDGSTRVYTQDELETLITRLKPHQVYQKHELASCPITHEPLNMARAGEFISGHEVHAVSASIYRDQYIPLQPDCICPCCKLHLTRAYLHHLWTEVPALCQRYLAMHNVWVKSQN